MIIVKTRHRSPLVFLLAITAMALTLAPGAVARSGADSADWRQSEQGSLTNHVQLTFADRFYKAGESYFSPDDSKIIFQGVEQPEPGEQPAEIYAMFVGDVVYADDRKGGRRITGLENIRRISPPGSANTCGWFHPTESNTVIFASTLTPPRSSAPPPGFHQATKKYRWSFPPQMRIFKANLDDADGSAESLDLIAGDEDAYQAECGLSPDGRHMVYCSLSTGQGDLYVHDFRTNRTTLLTEKVGYDGGPFFSPDGRRICYRSDRAGNNQLQIFVAELAFDAGGAITGIDREFQLTDNQHVNWCPFWHPQGRHLVYATSEESHSNYEVFIIDADPGDLPTSPGPTRYGSKKRRVTVADRFDGLPVFNATGDRMLWTSQRGTDGMSQLWVADFVLPIDSASQNRVVQAEPKRQISIKDPATDTNYVYDTQTHTLSRYDMTTHTLTPVTDAAEARRVMDLYKQQQESGDDDR